MIYPFRHGNERVEGPYTYAHSGGDFVMNLLWYAKGSDTDTIYGHAEGEDFYTSTIVSCLSRGDSLDRSGGARIISIPSTDVDPREFGVFTDNDPEKPIFQVAYQIVEVKYSKE